MSTHARDRIRRPLVVLLVLLAMLVLAAGPATAQEAEAPVGPEAPVEAPERPILEGEDVPRVPDMPDIPDVSVSVSSDDDGLSRSVVIILLLTVGSVAPGMLLLMTAFTRFVVVLGLTKQAIGLQTIPPPQVLVGLAMFLTFFVMAPVFGEVNEEAVQPLLAGEIDQGEAFERGFAPLRTFMLDQTRDDDLQLFIDLSGEDQPASVEEGDDPGAGLRDLGAADRVRHRLRDLRAVPRDRPRGLRGPDVARHDDAAPGVHLHAAQAPAVRAGRRVVAGGRVAGHLDQRGGCGMTDVQVIEILQGALAIGTKLSAPILITSLMIGVVISVIQTVTQIQEMSLTFVPKLVGVAVVMMVSGAWMIRELVGWVTSLWQSIPSLI